jgi:hypothetical protein
MAKIFIKPRYLAQLAALDTAIQELNERKITVLFELLGIMPERADFIKILDWELILVTVVDQKMAVQLNRLSAYIPTLKFVVREDEPLFTVLQGNKKRRVWKPRQD